VAVLNCPGRSSGHPPGLYLRLRTIVLVATAVPSRNLDTPLGGEQGWPTVSTLKRASYRCAPVSPPRYLGRRPALTRWAQNPIALFLLPKEGLDESLLPRTRANGCFFPR